MCLVEMIDFADMLGRMGELEAYALAMPAGRETPAFDHGYFMRHVGVRRIVRNSVDAGLRHGPGRASHRAIAALGGRLGLSAR